MKKIMIVWVEKWTFWFRITTLEDVNRRDRCAVGKKKLEGELLKDFSVWLNFKNFNEFKYEDFWIFNRILKNENRGMSSNKIDRRF